MPLNMSQMVGLALKNSACLGRFDTKLDLEADMLARSRKPYFGDFAFIKGTDDLSTLPRNTGNLLYDQYAKANMIWYDGVKWVLLAQEVDDKEKTPLHATAPTLIDGTLSVPGGNVITYMRWGTKDRDVRGWYNNALNVGEISLPVGTYFCRMQLEMASLATNPRLGFANVSGLARANWGRSQFNGQSDLLLWDQTIRVIQPNTVIKPYIAHTTATAVNLVANQTMSFLVIERDYHA